MPEVDLFVMARVGSCSARLSALLTSFQWTRSFEAWIGRPGKASKLDEAQKNVLSYSGTKMQAGSGWKPGRIGLIIVEFVEIARVKREEKADSNRRTCILKTPTFENFHVPYIEIYAMDVSSCS